LVIASRRGADLIFINANRSSAPKKSGARQPCKLRRKRVNSQVLLVECDDRRGLVHAITSVLLQHGVNVVGNQEFVERGAAMSAQPSSLSQRRLRTYHHQFLRRQALQKPTGKLPVPLNARWQRQEMQMVVRQATGFFSLKLLIRKLRLTLLMHKSIIQWHRIGYGQWRFNLEFERSDDWQGWRVA
jgi:hypothetical protein